MAARVVPFDVFKLSRILECGMVPVQVAHPLVNRRVARAHITDVALEVLDIDWIESNHGHVSGRVVVLILLKTCKQPKEGYSQPNIDFSQVLAKVVRAILLPSQLLLCAVQRFKQRSDVALVCVGRRREAGLVDAVVDQVILPLVRLLNLAAEILGIQMDAAMLFVDDVVKL